MKGCPCKDEAHKLEINALFQNVRTTFSGNGETGMMCNVDTPIKLPEEVEHQGTHLQASFNHRTSQDTQ